MAAPERRTQAQWFELYSDSHQNPVNQRIHWVCVPLIYWVVVGLIGCLPTPGWLDAYGANWAWLAALPVLAFYWRLSLRTGVLMTLLTVWVLAAHEVLIALLSTQAVALYLVLFVVLWVMQFVGHQIEGKRPSFFTDLQFLLIGPAWVFDEWVSLIDHRSDGRKR